MNRRTLIIVGILVVLLASIWIDLPNNPGIDLGGFKRSLNTVLGLDLRGGMQVLLEADVPAGQAVNSQSLEDAKKILENRSNGLGVNEVVFQIAGDRRIVGEFPGLTNTEEVITTLKGTGQLEFVDMGTTFLKEGTPVKTDSGAGTAQTSPTAVPTVAATPSADPTAATPVPAEKVYHTIMTGAQLKAVNVSTSQLGEFVVDFELDTAGAKTFGDFTSKNIGKYLAIVLDGKVISCPSIHSAITEGKGQITGNFTNDSANNLAIQLRYGALPVPLKVVESRVIGPTLGQDSLNKSIVAGLIGFAVVVLFMLIFYRLSGVVAVLAILNYALVTLAIYKLIPVTLTLPGIAGFLLSTGGALDANILMFERMKEELHAGRSLRQAVELCWSKAWSSIRDSNLATIITSIILFFFGSAFGASIVKGFAVTLVLGVAISVLSAFIVTRTLLSVVAGLVNPADHEKWFGA
jgi:preprotein translocase subunit SecD